MIYLRGVELPAKGIFTISADRAFLVSVWCGANRFEHIEVIRHDEAIKNIFEYNKMAGHKAFQRYFRKFAQADNHRVFGGGIQVVF